MRGLGRGWVLLGVLAAGVVGGGALPARVQAEARFVLVNLDPPDEGLNDPTPAAPVGGNPGRTLGEQRRLAMQHAADLWGAALDSDVDVRVDVSFEPLDCTQTGSVLGAASTTSAVNNLSAPGANAGWSYPAALANRLVGRDLDPSSSDILAQFNTLEPARCPSTGGWYYGLDGKPTGQNQADLVQVALHELGHGLGITQLLDQQTGALLANAPDPVVAQSLDTTSGQTLDVLTAAQRLAALTAAHQLVWTGQTANGLAASLLDRGTPVLSTTPAIAGFSGLLADTNFGAPPLQRAVSGPLMLGDPLGGERPPDASVAGAVILYEPNVRPSDLASELAQRGAAALLMVLPGAYEAPPTPLDLTNPRASDIPALSITLADGQALADARAQGAVTVSISERSDQPMGTDANGRLRLNAATPLQISVFGHWDTSLRPNQLMEPFTAPRDDPHALQLARAWLLDLGWRGACGDGRLDAEEACDDGRDNSDLRADACRVDCTVARCGDGVTDTGERCDGEPIVNNGGVSLACADDCLQRLCPDGRPASEALTCPEPEPPAPPPPPAIADAGMDSGACTACGPRCPARCGPDGGRSLPIVDEAGDADGSRTPPGRRADAGSPSAGGDGDADGGTDGARSGATAGTRCRCDAVGATAPRTLAGGWMLLGWVMLARLRLRVRHPRQP